MKSLRLILLILPLAGVSCTSIYGNRTTGVFAYNSLGGDAKGLAVTADGATAEQLSNSPAFQDLAKTIRTGIYMGAAKAIAGSLSGAWKSTTNAKTAAGTAKIQAQEATKQTAITTKGATDQAAIASQTEIATTIPQ